MRSHQVNDLRLRVPGDRTDAVFFGYGCNMLRRKAVRASLRLVSPISGQGLQGLLGDMGTTARAPWPGQEVCPHCGAAHELVRAEYRPEDPRRHVLTHTDANGRVCEAPRRGSREAGRSNPAGTSATSERWERCTITLLA
jgi:hypothetical protein